MLTRLTMPWSTSFIRRFSDFARLAHGPVEASAFGAGDADHEGAAILQRRQLVGSVRSSSRLVPTAASMTNHHSNGWRSTRPSARA
jgi:hypothetical protein